MLTARSYLETNPGQFDRIALADLPDVSFFEDAFRTCGDYGLVWMTVGYSPGAHKVATHMAAMKLTQFFGNATAGEFRDFPTDVVDKAFGIGGTQRMCSTATRLVVVRDPATGCSPVVVHKTLPRAIWDVHGLVRKQNDPPV